MMSSKCRWIGLPMLMAAVLAGCSSGKSSGGKAVCEQLFAKDCGTTCSTDASCEQGMFCSTGRTCDAECGEGVSCDNGESCLANGRCLATGTPGGGGNTGIIGQAGGGGSSAGGGVDGCVDQQITFTKTIPTVALLIDRSGSMDTALASGGQTRWDGMREVLTAPNTGLIASLQSEVRFGLAMYAGIPVPCPAITEVGFALDNYAAINAEYQASETLNGTPTGEALSQVASELGVYTKPGPKAIVLATDGEPNSCAAPGDTGSDTAHLLVTDAVSAAHASGIDTYVIFVGDPGNASTEEHLQRVASAGQGLAYDAAAAPLYSVVDDPSAIQAAFESIIYGVRSCDLKLNGDVQAGYEDQGTVTLDAEPLVQDDADGWQLKGTDTVELLGSACNAIKTGDHDVAVNFPCDGFIIVK
jgi:hypothetical protein